MIAQVTAAALASENKALAHPHSVDSLPTSANQEDHVSMAPAAGRRLWEMAANTRGVIAVEWLAACRGTGYARRADQQPTAGTGAPPAARTGFALRKDRYFAPDIENATALLAERHLTQLLPAIVSGQR